MRVSRFQKTPPARQVPPPLPFSPSALLNLEEAERFKNLLIFAQTKVEGYFSGKHKSPDYGSNVEFADYREYVTGEDVGHIDWRVYGKTRRLFVRKYEEETDMMAYLVVDFSGSMQYRGTGQESKFFRAARIAAVLAYLMIRQGDKASLTLFAEKVRLFLPPGGTRGHLHRMVSELEKVKPQFKTSLPQALRECAVNFRRRGRIVVLSDFISDHDALFDALGEFVHRKYEILLLQIVDPDELDLPQIDMARFVDLETNEVVEVEPNEIRQTYRNQMESVLADLADRSQKRRIQHAVVRTSDPYHSAIESYLGLHARGRRQR